MASSVATRAIALRRHWVKSESASKSNNPIASRVVSAPRLFRNGVRTAEIRSTSHAPAR